MAGGPRTSMDAWFYGVAICLLVVVTGTWYIARGMVRRSEGREVQAMLEKTNLADDESYRRQARNYVSELARNRTMTSVQRRKAEEIYFEAFRANMQIWMDGRFAGESDAETRRNQRESWRRHHTRFDAMMAE